MKQEIYTSSENKAAVEASFEAWVAGTGNPFELLANDACWTIEGNSVASKRYATKEDFLRDSSARSMIACRSASNPPRAA